MRMKQQPECNLIGLEMSQELYDQYNWKYHTAVLKDAIISEIIPWNAKGRYNKMPYWDDFDMCYLIDGSKFYFSETYGYFYLGKTHDGKYTLLDDGIPGMGFDTLDEAKKIVKIELRGRYIWTHGSLK